MFIRWQSRKRKRPEYYGHGRDQVDTHWRAILVESARVDGKPIQKHIAYLAGFTESRMAIPAQQRFIWDAVKTRLERLSNRIMPEDRRRIEAAFVQKIGRPPTKAQRAKLDRKRERTMASLGISASRFRKRAL